MYLGVAFHVLALLPLCIHAELDTIDVPMDWSKSLYRRRHSGHRVNGTISSLANVTRSAVTIVKQDDSDDMVMSILSHNSTVNTTHLIANDSSKPWSRLLIETNQSTHIGYQTINCDSATLGHDNAEAFNEMITQVHINLRVVIDEAKKGEASKYGFQALFKWSSNSQKVASLFAKIMNADGTNDNLAQADFIPLIICVPTQLYNESVQGLESLYNLCRKNQHWRAMQPWGSNIVLLCPSFWKITGIPTAGSCPKKNSRGVMQPNKNTLQLNRQSIFVHEMVHLHLEHDYGNGSEVYKVADAVALSEEASLRNPSNYAFFYAAIVAGCRKWPYKSTISAANDGGL